MYHSSSTRLTEILSYDSEASLYDPILGMFITADTLVPNIFDSQSLNRYAYCLNNPVKYIDPTGHFEGLGSMEGIGFDTNDYNSGGDGWGGNSPGYLNDIFADVAEFEARQKAEAARQKEIEKEIEITAINVFISLYIDRNYREAKRLLGNFTDKMFSLTGADYISINYNFTYRHKATLYGLIGGSVQYVADKYGNNYWGFGPTIGKSIRGNAVSLTLGYISGRFNPSEDTFL